MSGSQATVQLCLRIFFRGSPNEETMFPGSIFGGGVVDLLVQERVADDRADEPFLVLHGKAEEVLFHRVAEPVAVFHPPVRIFHAGTFLSRGHFPLTG